MERPLLPFMFPRWYRFQITSDMSVLQRLTGIALALGLMLIAWWLTAAAAGGALLVATQAFISSPIGVPLLSPSRRHGTPATVSSFLMPIRPKRRNALPSRLTPRPECGSRIPRARPCPY